MNTFNVAYNAPDGVRLYLSFNTTKEIAEEWRDKFEAKYVGKPYPNGKGWYPFTHPRVVNTSEAWQ